MSDATKQPDDVKHSPLPWRVSEVDGDGEVIARGMKDANGKGVNKGHDIEMFTEADADLIVRAVNCHAELVAACKAWVDYFDKLDRDSEPGDRVAEVRRQFHSNRVEATRAALARAGQAVPS